MACFVVPLVQAIATSVLRAKSNGNSILTHHLPALEKMLWGGTIMLIVDHVINGELTWRFPFFTALSAEGGASMMLHEMLTVGVPISLVITTVWLIYALVKGKPAGATI